MSGSVPVTWHLRGSVNLGDLSVTGQGSADLISGTTELNLTAAPTFPVGFDPAVSQFICNFALAGFTAVSNLPVTMRDAVARKLIVQPARTVKILNANGELLVRLEALTTMIVAHGAISVMNYMDGFSRLPAPVVRAWGEEILTPAAGGAATGRAHFRLQLESGAVCEGMTVVPYRFDRQDVWVTPAVRSIRDQSCDRTSASEVTLRATSTWREASHAVTNLAA